MSVSAIKPDMTQMGMQAMKDAGVVVTLPRMAVWIILARADRPLQVKEIKRHSVINGMDIHLSSIYAALRRLTSAKLLSLHVISGTAYYSLTNLELHQSIICKESGAKFWFVDHELSRAIESFCRKHGFDLADYMLTVHGQRTRTRDSDYV